MGAKATELTRFVDEVRSEPFLPEEIRDLVIKHLDNRLSALHTAWSEVIASYRNLALKDPYQFNKDAKFAAHNAYNSKMYSMNAGIGQVMKQVHEIRLRIQQYLRKFDPVGE